MEKKSSYLKFIVLFIVLAIITLISEFYIDWLWFKSVNFQTVFTTTLLSKIALWVVVFTTVFLFIWFNLFVLIRHRKEDNYSEIDEDDEAYFIGQKKKQINTILGGEYGKWAITGVSLLIAFLVSAPAGNRWVVVQQFLKKVPYGVLDPIFGKDIGFYFFNLSFYELIYSVLMSVLVFAVIIVAIGYFIDNANDLMWNNWKEFSFAKSHMALLLALIFATKAWGYKLSAYSILLNSSGLVFGANYTDVHARLLTYKVLMLFALLVAGLIIVNIFIKRLKWIVYSIAAWLIVAVLLGGVYPVIVQKMIVQPNEFNREKGYLENAISYTQQAYNLDEITHQDFDINYDLNWDDIENNRPTVDNIRLWDWQPLQDTYKSLQELRSYYVFHDVDIDRYMIDGQYRQVMLSAREMEDLGRNSDLSTQAKTWINQRLIYTHGYGITMSPVNEVGEEGLPHFLIQDVPPQFSTDLKITRPEIYFGERGNDYVIVNTQQQEFDYPMGEENVFATYEGENGVKVNSFARRLLLAWELKDYKILLSKDIVNESQVLLNRNISNRIQKVAPYLTYDNDPYIVIDEAGKLFWMLDAYTKSDKFPYSQPYDDFGNNYIRNSVKVVCDAYTGEMNFYIADENDPIIKTYANIFPDVYTPMANMPKDLRAHVRYPEDLFKIQTNIYKIYHMNDSWAFYNKEDSWVIPNEVVGEKENPMEPYYVITRLPGETEEEYIIMLPYTPNARPNMNAWMCARMDGDNYGKLLIYRFPKQETVYGPMQIESRINQNTEISQQLTLWDQGGSNIYRGNLLIIPIENSILYVEPLYLQAAKSRMPELKRVIVAYGNQVVMEKNLESALAKIFSGKPGTTPVAPDPDSDSPGTSEDKSVQELSKLARQYYEQADQAIKNGDWGAYGDNIKQLNEIIRQLEIASGNI